MKTLKKKTVKQLEASINKGSSISALLEVISFKEAFDELMKEDNKLNK